MRHRSPFLLLMIPALLLAPARAPAHGVAGDVTSGEAVVVAVRDDRGHPLADAVCRVFAPEETVPWLTGRTDPHGRVVFAPDRAGPWRVEVMAADGHGATVPVVVTADMLAVASGSAAGAGRPLKIMAGVGVLLGVFGIVALVARRRT